MIKKATLTMLAALMLGGCMNEQGHFRPPDPLGHALFDLFDPPNRAPKYAGTGYVVTSNMPPPQSESRPASPGGNTVWVAGYWSWNGNSWVWVPGQWIEPPHAGARWMVPQSYTENGQQYWNPGYWR
ncbi:MAG: hypothetical protein ABI443_07700 [Chthoniobacterales bacterium]